MPDHACDYNTFIPVCVDEQCRGIISWYLQFLNYLISMFIGGWTAGKKAGRKGWYYGLLLSGIYCILMWIIGFLALNIHLSLRSFIMLACCMLAGCIGGMLGVNTKNNSPHGTACCDIMTEL
ncbi:TIGR04086 family membrane protein [Paenibacillus larvae]|nr:TIGR04086 family membrane protein [Paenibacillus larvae]MDT2277320.1 TIGR04086 family membrane protein [Paenibacillus larvae]